MAVLGAGTGLGSGWLVPQADGGRLRWSPLPSESGHQAFAFLGREEEDFAVFARERLGRSLLRPDDVVTGRGLAVLHHFLTGRDLTPAAAAAEGLVGDQPTLRWYARFLGRTCAHWGAGHAVLQRPFSHRGHGVAQSCGHRASGFCGRFFSGSRAGGAGAYPCPPLHGCVQWTVGRGLAGGKSGRGAGRKIASSATTEAPVSPAGESRRKKMTQVLGPAFFMSGGAVRK